MIAENSASPVPSARTLRVLDANSIGALPWYSATPDVNLSIASGCKVRIHKHVDALWLLLVRELPHQARIVLQVTANSDNAKLHELRGLRPLLQRCLDALRNVWTVESNVLFESRSALHKLGFRVLQFGITVANVSPDVFAARGQCSLSTNQVQHVDQLLY